MHQTKDSMPAANQFLHVMAAMHKICSLNFKLPAPRRQPSAWRHHSASTWLGN